MARISKALLNEADTNATRTGSSVEGYLTALNWAWLQVRKEPKDYGSWAVQAHLWKKSRLRRLGALLLSEISMRT